MNLMKKEKLNTNWEVYNYLNITNRKLGKQYKYLGRDFMPDEFDVNEETIKERLFLNELADNSVMPDFVYEEKRKIKKHFKNSIKNCKNLLKNNILSSFSPKFLQKINIYMDMRTFLTKQILKDFRSQDFDEVEAYREIFNLNPILGEMFDELYKDKIEPQALLLNLENRYKKIYLEKVKEIEEKKKKHKNTTVLETINQKQKKNEKAKINKKDVKNLEKSVEKHEKMKKMKDIQDFKTKEKLAKTKNKEKL